MAFNPKFLNKKGWFVVCIDDLWIAAYGYLTSSGLKCHFVTTDGLDGGWDYKMGKAILDKNIQSVHWLGEYDIKSARDVAEQWNISQLERKTEFRKFKNPLIVNRPI